MSRRRLLSTRRQVPLDRMDEYLAGWRRLRDAAAASGARAWLFRAADRQDQFLEFVEFDAAREALADEDVTAAREELDQAFGAGHGEEWKEAL